MPDHVDHDRQGWSHSETVDCLLTDAAQVGDYGLAPVWFLEDYVPVNGEGQPVRWIPPEILGVLDRTGEEDNSDSLEESDSSDSEDGAGDDHEKYLKVFFARVAKATLKWPKRNQRALSPFPRSPLSFPGRSRTACGRWR